MCQHVRKPHHIAASCVGTALTEVSNDRLHLALTAPAARLALALAGQVAAGFAAAAGPGTPAASPSGSSAGSPAARLSAQRAAPRDPGGTGVMDDVQEDAFRRCGPGLPSSGTSKRSASCGCSIVILLRALGG